LSVNQIISGKRWTTRESAPIWRILIGRTHAADSGGGGGGGGTTGSRSAVLSLRPLGAGRAPARSSATAFS